MAGYGLAHYVYDRGREIDRFLAGFSPRKHALAVYVMSGFHDKDALMKRLGKYSTGKSCLSIKRLEGIDVEVLRELMSCSVAAIREKSG